MKENLLQEELEIVKPVVNRNAFMAHPENILLAAALVDRKSSVRELSSSKSTTRQHSRRQVSKTVGVLRENLLVVGVPIGRMYTNLLAKSSGCPDTLDTPGGAGPEARKNSYENPLKVSREFKPPNVKFDPNSYD